MTSMVSFDFQTLFIFTLLFLLISTLFLFVFFLFFNKQNNGFDLPPSPPSLPIIGHLHLLLFASIHKCFQKISSKYGPFLHLHIFNVPIVLVSSASVAYEIFKAQDTNISFRGAVAIDECIVFGSSGFFRASCGDYWKFMRKLIMARALGPQALERSRVVRAVELERFHKILLDKAMKKESLEIGQEAMRLVNNTLGKMSMGSSFSVEDNDGVKVSEFSVELASLSHKFCVAQIFHKQLEKKLGISLLKKEIMEVSNRFEELLEKILVKYEENVDKDQGTEFMDAMLAAYRDKNTEYKITRNHIKALLAELFFGAGDSSSSTTRWAMAEIINNPKILEKLREEIDSVVGKTRLVQETDLPKLPYLQAVVKESLRLHPVGAVLPREFQQDCKIGEFYIREGTSLVINAYAVMRDPDSWEDPNEFKPERFLVSLRSGQEDERKESFKFLPFGAGRRGCPGLNLGYSLVGTAVGVMVQCFDWEIKGDKVKMEEASGLRFFLALAHPLKCTPLPRKSINH